MTRAGGHLDGFELFEFEGKEVFRRGDGPGVIVIHEIPGITPQVAAFATMVSNEGFTVWLPSLFGTPGRGRSIGYASRSILHVCVSREFFVLMRRHTSRVVEWLRLLGNKLNYECPGPGIGVVGMCATGGFGLAMAVDSSTLAPVLSQPSLPVAVTPWHARDLGMCPSDLNAVRSRAGELDVLAFRFTRDPIAPRARFRRLAAELESSFRGEEINSGKANVGGFSRLAHSCLTLPDDKLTDAGREELAEARSKVVSFLRERLG